MAERFEKGITSTIFKYSSLNAFLYFFFIFKVATTVFFEKWWLCYFPLVKKVSRLHEYVAHRLRIVETGGTLPFLCLVEELTH